MLMTNKYDSRKEAEGENTKVLNNTVFMELYLVMS